MFRYYSRPCLEKKNSIIYEALRTTTLLLDCRHANDNKAAACKQ